jgi:hypothetical protein
MGCATKIVSHTCIVSHKSSSRIKQEAARERRGVSKVEMAAGGTAGSRVVVLDNGGDSCKVGLASDKAPR